MFHEALQMMHNNQKARAKPPVTSGQKIGHSTSVVNKMGSHPLAFSSSVAIHKLRESKWFSHSESKILCSVVESGFILEKKLATDSEELHQWGVAIWKTGYEKSKNIDYISVYTLITEKDKIKVSTLELKQFWTADTTIRINNHDDKACQCNCEEDTRKQIQHAIKNKNMKWHNSQHFVHWCRYTRPTMKRTEQMSERVKWNSVSVSAGMLMVRNRFRRPTTTN